VALSGELSQHDRTTALAAIRDGRARVCVCTDVAARGIDLPDLGLVVHADLPTDREALLHRSGRTGRAGRKGLCVLLVPMPKRRRAEQLFLAASISCSWGNPPSADEIRARDQERLLADPILAEAATGETLVLARRLLEGRAATDIAAALIRMYGARLPAPAERFDAAPTRESPARPAADGAKSRPSGPAAWFRINIGRTQNADPKWLLPLICKAGDLVRGEVGAIRVFDRETKFEVAQEAAGRFAAAIERGGEQEFVIATASPAPPARPAGPRPFAARKPHRAAGARQG
jgi:ATP-dependent RNA helicase DeaD